MCFFSKENYYWFYFWFYFLKFLFMYIYMCVCVCVCVCVYVCIQVKPSTTPRITRVIFSAGHEWDVRFVFGSCDRQWRLLVLIAHVFVSKNRVNIWDPADLYFFWKVQPPPWGFWGSYAMRWKTNVTTFISRNSRQRAVSSQRITPAYTWAYTALLSSAALRAQKKFLPCPHTPKICRASRTLGVWWPCQVVIALNVGKSWQGHVWWYMHMPENLDKAMFGGYIEEVYIL